jgi:hypothetical protein
MGPKLKLRAWRTRNMHEEQSSGKVQSMPSVSCGVRGVGSMRVG